MFLNALIERLHNSLHNYEQAVTYLHIRNVTDEEIEEFKLGYSRIVSVIDDGTEECKLFLDEFRNGRKFENKLIFPNYDMMGIPVGLLGRAIETKDFSLYLTKEGKYFGVLYGFCQAMPEIYKTGRVYVVEGPFDLFAFRKVFKNVVGTNTAELTVDQHEQLSFYADEIITVFDSDGPGRAATERAKENFKTKSVDLGFKDPANCLVQCSSVKKFEERVKDKLKNISWKP